MINPGSADTEQISYLKRMQFLKHGSSINLHAPPESEYLCAIDYMAQALNH